MRTTSSETGGRFSRFITLKHEVRMDFNGPMFRYFLKGVRKHDPFRKNTGADYLNP